jgi:hypothetical protein
MGANVSSTRLDQLNESITNSCTKILGNIINENTNKVDVIQNIRIDNEGTINCKGDFSIVQKSNANANVLATLDVKQIQDISNQLSTSIANEVQKSIEQANKDLNLGQANVSKDSTTLTNIITKNINTDVETTIKNSVDTSATTDQVITFINKGTLNGSSCNFIQDGGASIVSSNIVTSLMDTLTKNETADDILNKYKFQESQTNAGINLTMIFGFIFILIIGGLVIFGGGTVSSVMKYIIPISMVIALIIGIIYGIKKEYIVSIICGVAVAVLGGLEVMSLKKDTPSKSSKK